MKTAEEKRLSRNEYMREYNREYRKKNKDRMNAQARKRAKERRAGGWSRAAYLAQWRLDNPESHKESCRRWNKKFVRTVDQKIAHTLRVRICNALRARGLQKPRENSAVRDLGCTTAEFKNYIAQRFSTGMNWANHGEWHIDHIRPLSSFDLSDPEQVRVACHFTNLQPLWARDNLIKRNKYNESEQD